ncbi:MAG: amino acid adenylation domain-containing protein [Crocinitomix sp.]|nr:amino acid adenylation domain-containing protein [Crocinitomix sp.]
MDNVKQILDQLRKEKVRLELKEGDKLNLILADDVTLSNEMIALIKENKSAIIEYVKSTQKKTFEAIPVAQMAESYPLSAEQNRLWILCQFEEGAEAYNMPFSLPLGNQFNIELFAKALEATVARHEILRTVFREDVNGEPRQFIVPVDQFEIALETIDFSQENEAELKASEWIENDSYQLFDLREGPLFRTALIQLPNEEIIFYYNMHHIISDAWSMSVMGRDVLAFYQNEQLDALTIQHKDYTLWRLEGQKLAKFSDNRAYWMDRLSGEIPLINLPAEKNRPKTKTFKGSRLYTYLSDKTTQRLVKYSRSNGGTLFNGLLTVWNALLHLYTAEETIVLGTAVAGRSHIQLEDQIGFYVNMLALRNEVKSSDSFQTLFQQINENTLNDLEHQDHPFNDLVDNLELETNHSRSPLFDVLFSIQERENEKGNEFHKAGDIEFGGTCASKYDLEIMFQEEGESLYFELRYNTEIYEEVVIKQLMYHFGELTNCLLDAESMEIGKIDFLTKEEKKEQLVEFNQTEFDYPKNESIISLFEKQVTATPQHIALTFEDKKWTYTELNQKANQVACFLKNEKQVAQGDMVSIQLDKSDWVMIVVLATLKVGAAYVPISPDYPQERVDFIKKDTGSAYCIDENELINIVKEAENQATQNQEPLRNAESIAYVMYTSGSTGAPKGVVVQDRGAVRLVKSTNYISLTENDRLLSTGAFSFDATTFEFWGMLLNGGELVLSKQKDLLSTDHFHQVMHDNHITKIFLTSGWFNQLVDDRIEAFSGLKTLLTGGEVLSPDHISRVREKYPSIELISCYGPTENTAFSLTYPVDNVPDIIPIGKPISNTQCYVLNENEQLVPKGVIGEIYVGGSGLALEYLNRPELNPIAFINDPFHSGEKLYKTGDLGKWLWDGNLSFKGRKDNQIKIRGHRIEIEEIEKVYGKVPGMLNAVILALDLGNNGKELVSYFQADNDLEVSVIREFIKNNLPEYMVPSYFVKMENFPLNKNGKIDRKSLPQPNEEALYSGAEYVAPETDLEKQLIEICQGILNHERIGMKDNFFEIGGNSIKAMKLVNKIQMEFEIKIRMERLFSAPTMSALLEEIDYALWIGAEDEEELEEITL